ncbi:A24 family peptidase [Shimia marina]|uniref:Flp pilus assembly protein, protease CpaA n=1 Tax=Shimia marina TaxID=321267 RepID=A0A0P1EQ59_9RHOB|nr:prepilin peptidase [Shimia marina]CUH52289.1 Flp pilus assembly protein, protease CpaA [Shimia marina]SFE07702.1 prepilin peptidase CpaA [Shimia marina]
MQVSATFALWSLIFALPLCVYIFWMDMKHKRISNLSVWALFAVFVAVGLLTLPFTEFAWRFANYAVVFAVLILMWMLRQVGAGDVKMAAVAALFVSAADARAMLFITFGSILAATVATLIVRNSPLRRLAPDWAAWRIKASENDINVGTGDQMTLPMGTGIGLALCTYLVLGTLYGI